MTVDALQTLRSCCCDGVDVHSRVVVVAAHPDDEVIGVGGRLSNWRDARIVHITDGSPRDLRDARALGLDTRDAYAALRRTERARALAIAGLDASRTHDLARADQEAVFDLVGLAGELAAIFAAAHPDLVITHPYEGGHPDHDATAFAVHAATCVLARDGRHAPFIAEMTSYHAGEVGIRTGCFLDAHDDTTIDGRLPADAQARKRAMLECYASQRQTLQFFACVTEPVRVAPAYHFGLPPHDGQLYYERFDWGMTGPRWRALARSAADELGLAGALL